MFNLPTTRRSIERLQGDGTLRRLCGWSRLGEVPSEATFSRAFAEFAASQMPSRLHEALIRQTQAERLIGHIARDSTAIVAREAPPRRATPPKSTPAPARRRRGRPRKGEASPPREPSRLQRRRSMSLDAMLADLPRRCDTGIERDAKGFQTRWTGYKLHIDTADSDIPISCVLTSASVHDSQVAIPLATLTADRVTSLYDLMDSAYDAAEIRDHSRSLGHVPIIAVNPRARAGLEGDLARQRGCLSVVGHRLAEDVRYDERTSAERVNANLKDNHGGETVRVRGNCQSDVPPDARYRGDCCRSSLATGHISRPGDRSCNPTALHRDGASADPCPLEAGSQKTPRNPSSETSSDQNQETGGNARLTHPNSTGVLQEPPS